MLFKYVCKTEKKFMAGEEKPLFEQQDESQVIDDPYTFGKISDASLETSEQKQEEGEELEQAEESTDEDQPFYAKYGFESEEALTKALEKAKDPDTDSQKLLNRISQLENMVLQSAQPRAESKKQQPDFPEMDEQTRERISKKLKEDDGMGAVADMVKFYLSSYQPPVDDATRVSNMIMNAMLDPNKPDFKELAPEIATYLESLPNFEEVKDNPLVLDLAYNAVKAKKAVEKANKAAGTNKSRNAIVSGRNGAAASTGTKKVDRAVSYDTMFGTQSRGIDYLVGLLDGKNK